MQRLGTTGSINLHSVYTCECVCGWELCGVCECDKYNIGRARSYWYLPRRKAVCLVKQKDAR